MTVSRRDALAGALSLGGGLTLFGGLGTAARLALAGTNPDLADKYYLFCNFSGGWDVLLGLDPRDPDIFTSDRKLDTFIEPAYDQLFEQGKRPIDLGNGIAVGPYFGDLADWIDRVCIVRGMSMDTLTHEAGLRRFLTGKPPSGLLARGSSMNTILAAQNGEPNPIPSLAMNCETYNADQPAFATALRVSSVDDLLRVLRPGEFDLSTAERERIAALFAQHAACPASMASTWKTDSYGFRNSARDLVGQGLEALFDFNLSTPEMVALRARYNISPYALSTPNAAAAMAATAITSGISRTVSITVATGLDTHYDDWERDQGPRQQTGFDLVAALMADLDEREYQGTGESWLDHTVIVGFSEFSRTALRNSNSGRDHSLTNACFLAGGGIVGGRVLGRSSDVGMAPQALDLATGQYDPAGEIPKPEHIFRALLTDLGIDDDIADLRVDPLTALFG